MGYAAVAGLPPVTGLYATLVPLLVYFLLGPSRILVLGPDSAICPLVAAAIVPLAAAGDPSSRIRARRPSRAARRDHHARRRPGSVRLLDRSAVDARARRLPDGH